MMSAGNVILSWGRTALPPVAGMAGAQMVATLYVRHSNLLTAHAAAAVASAGWMPMPLGPAADSLKLFSSAMGGGLFFTLSVGAVLVLVTWGSLALWRMRKRSTAVLIAMAAAWLGLIAVLNIKGRVLYPSLFAILVPALTAGAFLLWPPPARSGGKARAILLPACGLVLLAALWGTRYSPEIFTTIRDRILLGNPIGAAINDFYYRYTLYAAEPFKTFDQKTIRTCRLQIEDADLGRRLVGLLAAADVLPTESAAATDLTIVRKGDRLRLIAPGGEFLETPAADLTAHLHQRLQEFSRAADRLAAFRHLIFIGLLLGFPILLYITFYSLLCLPALLFLPPDRGRLLAAGLCLLAGIALFLAVAPARPRPLSADDAGRMLADGDIDAQASALRYIENHHLEISRYPAYRTLLHSPSVVVRYYLARALSSCRAPECYADLLAMTADPQPNVICQAYFGLGRMGRTAAVAPILANMAASDHWYTQWYAYRALRSLGWSQRQSK